MSVLSARGLYYSYGAELVLQDVSLSIEPGEFVALVGPNGSGKTTLLKILLGLLEADAGSVEVFGSSPKTHRRRIGYVPQRSASTSGLTATVEEIVATGRLGLRGWWRRDRQADIDAIDHALQTVDLLDERKSVIGQLSGGQQQRAFIARALASEPKLLVLDEPSTGVDVESVRRFRDALVHQVKAHNSSVLLVSHELSSVATDLDRVVVLKRGVRFDGRPEELTDTGVSLGIHADDLPLWLEGLH